MLSLPAQQTHVQLLTEPLSLNPRLVLVARRWPTEDDLTLLFYPLPSDIRAVFLLRPKQKRYSNDAVHTTKRRLYDEMRDLNNFQHESLFFFSLVVAMIRPDLLVWYGGLRLGLGGGGATLAHLDGKTARPDRLSSLLPYISIYNISIHKSPSR